MTKYTEDQLTALRDRHEAWIMSQPGVTGTGVGLGIGGEIVLRIFTSGATQATRLAVAAKLVGVPIAWDEGDIVPQGGQV